MTPAFGILFLWLYAKIAGRKPGGSASTSAPAEPSGAPAPLTASTAPATQSTAIALKKTAIATKTQKPSDIDQALKASREAMNKLHAQSQALASTKKAAAPWPASKPPDLPPFPAGWQPDTPPPPAVVTRAWQLLPILWKKGKGSTALETIKGRWITFRAEDHGNGKKGVTAYRVKAAATR